MPVARVVITKEMSFRGKPERWSNGYRFSLPTIDQATIKTLALALRDWERGFHAAAISFVYANGGLDAPGANAVYAEEFAAPLEGTAAGAGTHPEVCVMAESKIAPRRYARKWFHTLAFPGNLAGSNNVGIADTSRGDLNTAFLKLTNGTLPGGAVYCQPNGATLPQPFTCDPWLRTRQFKRRSPRRPTVLSPGA